MALVKLTRLNDRGEPHGELHLNPDHVVGIIGSETEVAVHVVTVAGTFDVQQLQSAPEGEQKPPSVKSQLGG